MRSKYQGQGLKVTGDENLKVVLDAYFRPSRRKLEFSCVINPCYEKPGNNFEVKSKGQGRCHWRENVRVYLRDADLHQTETKIVLSPQNTLQQRKRVVYAITVCLSVCLSVCHTPFVHSELERCRNEKVPVL